MQLRRAVLLALAATAWGVPATPAAATPRGASAGAAPFAAAGTGTVRFEARGEALVSSARVRRGLVRFSGAGRPPLLQCVQPRRAARSCARPVRDPAGISWQVVRPVRFLYEGGDFAITVVSPAGFRLLVLGSGAVVLRGAGRWSLGGEAQTYEGAVRLELP
jgi:autotransporter-associated beta strand protein